MALALEKQRQVVQGWELPEKVAGQEGPLGMVLQLRTGWSQTPGGEGLAARSDEAGLLQLHGPGRKRKGPCG